MTRSGSKPLICFIDDSPQERKLFQTVFGDEKGAFQVICAESLDEAKSRLAEIDETPALFILDLYFPGGETADPPADLNKPVRFEDDGGDINKAYLNLEIARKRFMALRVALGQTPEGGLKLLSDVQQTFPGVPAITYTRKGTIEEADLARKTGALRVLQKPSGDNWKETLQLTRSRRQEMEDIFRHVITRNPFDLLSAIVHYAGSHVIEDELKEIAMKIMAIRQRLLSQIPAEATEDEVDQLMECTNHPFIRALIYQLRPKEGEIKFPQPEVLP